LSACLAGSLKPLQENGITDEPMRQEEGDEIIDSTFRDRGTGDWRMREHVVGGEGWDPGGRNWSRG
jgi:hypothetical protein